MKPVEKVLDWLEGARKSNGSWKALCPAHEDREPSLSVSEGDDGRAFLRCFAGCNNEEIAAALGLEMKDLFERNGYGGGGSYIPRKHSQRINRPHSRTTPPTLGSPWSSWRA